GDGLDGEHGRLVLQLAALDHQHGLERDRRVGARPLEDLAEELVLAPRRVEEDGLVGRVDAEVGDEREEVVARALDDDEGAGADGLDGAGRVQLHLDALAEGAVREDAGAGAAGGGERFHAGRVRKKGQPAGCPSGVFEAGAVERARSRSTLGLRRPSPFSPGVPKSLSSTPSFVNSAVSPMKTASPMSLRTMPSRKIPTTARKRRGRTR